MYKNNEKLPVFDIDTMSESIPDEARVAALLQHKEIDFHQVDDKIVCNIEEVVTCCCSENDSTIVFFTDSELSENEEEWLVLTEKEREDAFDVAVDNTVDLIKSEIPECYHKFIDEGKIEEAVTEDGHGIALASYDHKEIELEFEFYSSENTNKVERISLYLFRTN